ncbi:Myc proto-oncogene protein [Geodia barretti]|nr:Myc proto-oncogene protein [Geodia barretti]
MWSGHLCERRSLAKKPPAPLASVGSANSSLQNTPGDSGTGGGVYTPSPSPPPPASVAVGGDSSHDDEGVESDCCVSPSVVFPSILTSPTKILPRVGSKVDSTHNNTTAATETTEATTTASSPVKKNMLVLRNSNKAERDDPDWEESGDEIGGRHGYERSQQRRKRKLSSAATVAMGANSRIQPQSTESSTSDEEIDVVTVTSADRSKASRKRSHPSSLSAPCSRQTSPHPPQKRRKYHTKRLQRLSSAGSTVGETVESEDEARRASHNVLERKRRNDLKSSFQRLREEIPELEDNQRAPKVTILRKAMEFIRHMQELEQVAEAELVAEKRRKLRLVERLNQLRAGSV